MKTVQSALHPRTLMLGVAASAWAENLLGAESCSPRQMFWLGLPCTLMLCLVSALVGTELSDECRRGTLSKLGSCVLGVWFLAELVRTAFTAHTLCRAQFDSLAVLGLLPLLLLAGWALPTEVFDRSSVVLWGAAALAALLCICGLWGQLRWQNLYTPAPGSTAPLLPIYPEYFAFGLLCPPEEGRRGVWMPLGTLAIQVAHCLLLALLFGSAGELIQPGRELLGAVTLGGASSFDAVFLLVWLAAALFRVCVLAKVFCLLAGHLSARPPRRKEGAA